MDRVSDPNDRLFYVEKGVVLSVLLTLGTLITVALIQGRGVPPAREDSGQGVPQEHLGQDTAAAQEVWVREFPAQDPNVAVIA
jgi:hypothetical protein